VINQHNTSLNKLLDSHNVFQRLETLQSKINDQQWDTSCQQEYESLDATITSSMLTAENNLSKRITTTYQWPPKLKQAVQCLRYWHLRLRQTRNLPVSLKQLECFRVAGGISPEEQALIAPVDIKSAQSNAYKNLKTLQAQHQELRDHCLEDLAEAIVLDRSPSLSDDKAAHILVEKNARQLQQLISREKMRKMYRKIGRTLEKRHGGGLSRIDVPDASAASSTSGNPNNPKTWKGPWRSVTNPNEIATVVCQINAAQYHQAHDTPFGSGPPADMIGRQGDTVISADLLQGKLPTSLPSDLLPETLHVLQSLATPTPTADISPIITDEEFVQTYRVAQENTSSSPSG